VPAVDPVFAQYLQAEAEFLTRVDAAAVARWGATALTSERVTAVATKAAAQAQADRELAFFARGPFALDGHQVPGVDWLPSRGRVVNLTIDQLGYDSGVDVFVLEVETDRSIGMSTITVLRPLGGPS
jgi:hypothetical protein